MAALGRGIVCDFSCARISLLTVRDILELSAGLQLLIIFTVNCSVCKMLKINKNVCQNSSEFKMASLNCFFSLTSSPKPKDLSFTVINDE